MEHAIHSEFVRAPVNVTGCRSRRSIMNMKYPTCRDFVPAEGANTNGIEADYQYLDPPREVRMYRVLEAKVKDLEGKLSASIKENEASHKNFEKLEKGVLKLSQQFAELYLTKCQSDIIIYVQDKEIKAHKSVLAARSTVFRAMFETDMAEKCNHNVIIEDFEPNIVEDFLQFIYSGKLDVISSNNAARLYMIADKYNVNELKETCSECLECNISEHSFFEVFQLAILHNEQNLLEATTKYFLNNSYSIFSTPQWITFMEKNAIMANELLLKMAVHSVSE